MPTRKWKGFDPFTPLQLEERCERTSKIYSDILHRVGWKIKDMNGKLNPWNSRWENLRDRTVDAFGDVVNCGRWHGNVLSCECGAEYGRPFGCGNRWCLNCDGIQAMKRAGRIQNKTDRLHQGESFVWGRCVFTVHPDHQPICSSKEGSITMQKRAVKSIQKVLDLSKKQFFGFTTFHPTSSKYPDRKHPHVELIWAHADVAGTEIHPLELNEKGILKPIELDYLQDIWQGHYPGTKNLNVSYYKELHFGILKYLVRAMAEDVWHSIREGRLGGDETGTIPPQAEVRFREPGGVEFWKHYHRVRWHGAARNNIIGATMRRLNKPRIEPSKPCINCPDCEDGELTIERDEEGIRIVSLSPTHEPDIDHIMFTTWKSTSRKGDEALV